MRPRAQKEAFVDLMRVSNGYQALMPWLEKFDSELERTGKLSEQSQAELRKCVRALHEVDRFAERLYR